MSRLPAVLAGAALVGASLAGCAGPRVLTTLSPQGTPAVTGRAALVLAPPESADAARDLAGGRLAARAPAAGQTPDYYVLVSQAARPGKIGVMGPAPAGASPAWVEAPRKGGWALFGRDKPVRTVSLTLLDARTGQKLADVTAADGKPGDRQPLSALVDAALARAGLVTP